MKDESGLLPLIYRPDAVESEVDHDAGAVLNGDSHLQP